MQNTAEVKITPRKRPLGMRIWNHKWFYVMFLPVLVAVIVFHYLPMFGISYAFTSWNLIKDPIPVGFSNFERMFRQPNFWTAFTNTLEISVIKLLMNTFMSVIISLLLNEMVSTRAKKLAQTIIYLPHFMSWVVTAGLFNMLFSPTTAGLVNQLLIKLGFIENSIYFLGEVDMWRPTYYIINIWHDTGWGTIIFMATLTGIDPGIYEAASIDGAGRWKKMYYITLPALANTIITVLILNLAKVMNLFESVFVLQNDAVNQTAEVLQTYVYNQTFNSGAAPDVGYTTAIGLFRSLVGMLLVLACNFASKKVRGRGIV